MNKQDIIGDDNMGAASRKMTLEEKIGILTEERDKWKAGCLEQKMYREGVVRNWQHMYSLLEQECASLKSELALRNTAMKIAGKIADRLISECPDEAKHFSSCNESSGTCWKCWQEYFISQASTLTDTETKATKEGEGV